jgi:hypothetical protein
VSKETYGLLLVFGSLCLVVQAHGLQEGDVLLQLHHVALQPRHLLREFAILLPQLVEQRQSGFRASATAPGAGWRGGRRVSYSQLVCVCVHVCVCVCHTQARARVCVTHTHTYTHIVQYIVCEPGGSATTEKLRFPPFFPVTRGRFADLVGRRGCGTQGREGVRIREAEVGRDGGGRGWKA